ncbi:chromodomain-helicase-DNA-binding protein Mi-2 homolog [Cryptotermes secundus]|uniref:chromodomain-helicase-DNA-binding protein Mi-2 homolog n=1 Tax=Cryptotermes secundus TaxID=105785 RepID=UPI000CD7DD14|nr:chromodomain-helicase-DNA-binding protein Mi-2 homolog [Cryptotermes secundus]
MTKRRENSPRRKEDNDSYESRAQPNGKRRKMGDIASENSRDADCPHLPAVTAKVKTPVRRIEDTDSCSDTDDTPIEPCKKRRKRSHSGSERSSDTDCPPQLPALTETRKTPSCRTEESDSCSDSDESPIKPCRKSSRSNSGDSENESSDSDCPLIVYAAVQGIVAKNNMSYHDDEPVCDDEGEVTGHTSMRYSRTERNRNIVRVSCPETEGTEQKNRRICCRTEESDSCNDSDESPIKPCRESSRSNSGDSENESSDSDCPVIVYAAVQGIVTKNDKSYHDDEPVCDDEGEVTGHTSMRYSRTERNRNIVRVSCPETEGEGVSDEVRIFSRHSTAAPTTESGNIGAEPMPSTSSGAAAHKSQCRKDKESENCPACPICLEQFTTQEVGTIDTCDHIFCADCIKKWGQCANTCPVDRQVFSIINVRPHPGGEIITEIPFESRSQQLLFCRMCGDSDHGERMLICDECNFAFHFTCLAPPLNTTHLLGWTCPYCVYRFFFSDVIEFASQWVDNENLPE